MVNSAQISPSERETMPLSAPIADIQLDEINKFIFSKFSGAAAPTLLAGLNDCQRCGKRAGTIKH
jgi:hypothetical protein